MITHFKTYKLHRYIESVLVQDTSENDKVKDSLALSQIHQAINRLIFKKIVTTDTAKKIWDILEKSYKGIPLVKF